MLVLIVIMILAAGASSLNFLINDVKITTYENNCEPKLNQVGDRNIILRLDDIQAHFLRDVQMKMIKDTLNRNYTIVLGVIPYRLNDDKKLVQFLKKVKCDVEIALHGYNNLELEFEQLGFEEAQIKINKGLDRLKEIEDNIITFIPPNNKISIDAKRAIYSSNFKIISANARNSVYGFTTSTYDWDNYNFVSYEDVIESCSQTLDKGNNCIIMIHPQDYISNNKFNPEKYKNYIRLLEGIKELDAKVVNFRDLVN